MMKKLLRIGASSALLLSATLCASAGFAAEASPTTDTLPKKAMSVKAAASRQAKLSDMLTVLDAKLADQASASTDKNVMDQATLVHKAAGEAKKAADDLNEAAKLSKSRKS